MKWYCEWTTVEPAAAVMALGQNTHFVMHDSGHGRKFNVISNFNYTMPPISIYSDCQIEQSKSKMCWQIWFSTKRKSNERLMCTH